MLYHPQRLVLVLPAWAQLVLQGQILPELVVVVLVQALEHSGQSQEPPLMLTRPPQVLLVF